MKRIQCTECGQVFWTELQLDESLISSGEWVENPCPKCGAKWAVFEPQAGIRGTRGRRAELGPKRRGRPSKTVQIKGERTPTRQKPGDNGFSPAAIRRLRKKLGVSQTKFASLVGVSIGTIVGWESGKFKPRGSKVAELSNLQNWDKEDVRTKVAKVETKPAEQRPMKRRGKKSARTKSRKQEKQVEWKASEALSSQESPELGKAEEPKSQEIPQSQVVQGPRTAKATKKRGGRTKARQEKKN